MKRPRDQSNGVAANDIVNAADNAKAKKRKVDRPKSDDNANGNTPKIELSKEERRQLKKSRKSQSEGTSKQRKAPNVDHEAGEENKTRDPAKTAAKAERKAEKARLKAAKDQVPNGGDVSDEPDEVKMAEAKAKRKEARKSEKEQKKAAERTTASPVETKATRALGNQLNTSYTEDPNLTALQETDVSNFLASNFITVKDPSTHHPLRPITKFSYLPESSQSSTFSTFSAPTAIQASAWPFLLSGRDVVGVAETGSGKTLAFGIPCIRSVSSARESSNPARAVIISPTRELAVQIHTQMQSLCTPVNKIHTACVYGGVAKDPQRLALSTAHIVVATPGRLLDLIEEGSANLAEVKYLVLDEADRMLEKGFENEIRKIVATTPSTSQGRQTLMFTATWPESVRELAATFMKAPVHIHIGENNADGELRANTRIEQKVEVVDPRDKESRMLQIIKKYQSGKAKDDRILVFCLYKKEATRVEGFLRSKGLRVAGIHGDLSQERRMAALEGFKSGECPLLVATDVAARGLDIPAVKLVLNVTFPLTVEDYVHRIG
ncbi:MAG: hypothetical protein Q9169_005949, partial [Polycauliona sp. 2 TL-2023]